MLIKNHRVLMFSGLALLLCAAPDADAQSLWGVDGGPGTVTQVTGPPAGPCLYPNGPILNSFGYAVPFPPCPSAGPFPPFIPVGDVTVDMFTDNVWVTDGFWVTEYTKAGVPVSSFTNPMPMALTGLGWGVLPGAGPVLWMTDGVAAAAVIPPPPPGCVPPIFVVPPFPLLATPLPATDIDYEPISGTLFLSSAAGVIANELIGGGPGPFGVFPPPCGIAGLFLDGVAVDKSTCRHLYATDGLTIAYMDFAGLPAPPTFYTPAPCYPWPGSAPISGLAFDASPITYGGGCDPTGLVPPSIGALGQAVSPNPAFSLTLAGAVPGSSAFVLLGTGAPCPAPIVMGCPILVFPISLVAGPIPVPAAGAITLTPGIPPGLGCTGVTAYLQWLVAKPAGGIQTTEGLALTIATP